MFLIMFFKELPVVMFNWTNFFFFFTDGSVPQEKMVKTNGMDGIEVHKCVHGFLNASLR